MLCNGRLYYLTVIDLIDSADAAGLIVCCPFALTDLTCAAGESYSFTGPRCPNTCSMLGLDRCSQMDVEGCVCPAGQVKEGSSCVDPLDCGCADSTTGEYFSVIQILILLCHLVHIILSIKPHLFSDNKFCQVTQMLPGNIDIIRSCM